MKILDKREINVILTVKEAKLLKDISGVMGRESIMKKVVKSSAVTTAQGKETKDFLVSLYHELNSFV